MRWPDGSSDVESFTLRLPATSANLGPALDAAAMALDLWLTVRARPAERFAVTARGRDEAICGALERHLILETYREALIAEGLPVRPLAIHLENEIPIGKGCGSSAAARLAGLAMAVHFGRMAWSQERIVSEAARREGHADNAAACWWGGLVIVHGTKPPGEVRSLRLPVAKHWPVLLVVPEASLPTATSRGLLPDRYGRDAVTANLQNALAVVAALMLGKAEVLGTAFMDHLHQPYRAGHCPLLPVLQPLMGRYGIAGVMLSGAGPAVLGIVESEERRTEAAAAMRSTTDAAGLQAEIVATAMAADGVTVATWVERKNR